MSEQGPRLERFLERAVGLGVGSQLHPSVLLQHVHQAAERSVNGESVANAYTVQLSPADAAAFQPHFRRLSGALERMLDALVTSRQLQRAAPWQFEFIGRESVRPGSANVVAEFRNAPSTAAHAPGPTRAIKRQRALALVVDGVGRVRLTHTPFTIGRDPGCDLCVRDLAVSRRHAEIDTDVTGALIMRDLGSRNRLVVGGVAQEEVGLEPGMEVIVGSTMIRLEADE